MKNLSDRYCSGSPEDFTFFDMIEQNVINGHPNKEHLKEICTSDLFKLFQQDSHRLLNEVQQEIESRLFKKYRN